MIYDRLLFLDIDGVLNSSQMPLRLDCHLCGRSRCWFDPAAVTRLNTVLARTEAMIVVSSSWRCGRTLSALREILHGHGVTPRTVVGMTPTPFAVLSSKGSDLGTVTRGEEIHLWLRSNETPRSWAVLDDDSRMDPLRHRHVRTGSYDGLQDRHVEQLCALLLQDLPKVPCAGSLDEILARRP
jgi:hypothetical protein